MGNRIDVLAFLAQVVEENTTGYRSDFQYDVRMLTQAAQEKDMRDRVFYWMSRPSGTWCVKEREVFLQGSGAHSIWTYYADQPDLRHTFATHALASGVDAKTLSGILGHTNASFTLDTYTHVTPDMQRAASDVVGDFLKNLLGEELNPWPENEKAEPAP